MKNDGTFVRMRSGDHLGDAKMSKKGTSLREFNFFINCDRHKRFSQNERRRADLQNVASDFLTVHTQASKNVSRSCNRGAARAFWKSSCQAGKIWRQICEETAFLWHPDFSLSDPEGNFWHTCCCSTRVQRRFLSIKVLVVFSFGVFSSTSQVGPIDHCQRSVKHTNCLPVTFTRAKLVRPWKSPCRKSMGLVSSQCKELFWYKPWSREIPDCLHEIYHVIAPALSHSDHRLHADQRCKRIHNAHKFELPSRDCC